MDGWVDGWTDGRFAVQGLVWVLKQIDNEMRIMRHLCISSSSTTSFPVLRVSKSNGAPLRRWCVLEDPIPSHHLLSSLRSSAMHACMRAVLLPKASAWPGSLTHS